MHDVDVYMCDREGSPYYLLAHVLRRIHYTHTAAARDRIEYDICKKPSSNACMAYASCIDRLLAPCQGQSIRSDALLK